MAYLRPYRVAETTTTTGTGSITLAGAVAGYSAFSGELANADTATIVIEAIDASGVPTGDYEICDTTFTSPTTLSRGTLRDSSTGSRISFAAGTKRVFAISPRDAISLASADVTGTLSVANGGSGATTLTGVVIGNGASAFTTVTAPSGAIVGTTDTQTLSGKTLTDPAIIGAILEDVYTISDAAGVEIDPGNGSIQLWTLGASRTPVATNFAAGESVTLMVNDGTAYTVTWTTIGVVWVGGSAPTLPTTGYGVIELWKVATTVYGAYVGAVA